jgi:2-polyprenyl-3-methyl-5-hydroxy-6-metoxy-1,4-benzoquinol methylase
MQTMDKSERFWNKSADTYDREEQKDNQTYVKIVEKTKKYLKSSDIVLDYGCGTGTIDLEIAGDVKKIYAIDIASKMLDLAQMKTIKRNIKNIDYMQATIYDERLNRETFNVLTAYNIVHLVEDTPGVVKRINELLKPGGLFVSTTPCMGEKKGSNILLSLAGKIGLTPDIISFKLSELENLVTSGSFKIIESERLLQSAPLYFIVASKL